MAGVKNEQEDMVFYHLGGVHRKLAGGLLVHTTNCVIHGDDVPAYGCDGQLPVPECLRCMSDFNMMQRHVKHFPDRPLGVTRASLMFLYEVRERQCGICGLKISVTHPSTMDSLAWLVPVNSRWYDVEPVHFLCLCVLGPNNRNTREQSMYIIDKMQNYFYSPRPPALGADIHVAEA